MAFEFILELSAGAGVVAVLGCDCVVSGVAAGVVSGGAGVCDASGVAGVVVAGMVAAGVELSCDGVVV